jgi:TonB-like protein
MFLRARLVVPLLFSVFPAALLAQAGPSEPQVINGADTARINIGPRKFGGYITGTVRVGEDGRARDVLITEVTADPGFEAQVMKVLQSARFRPAIDGSGRPVEASIEMKVELKQSTGQLPKPFAAKPDPMLTDKEKERVKRMRCADFAWEWDLIRAQAGDAAAIEFMPRIATTMYVNYRSEMGDYVDAKIWKAAPKVLRDTAEQCKNDPNSPFWDGIFKTHMDEAVPK